MLFLFTCLLLSVPEGCFRCESGSQLIFMSNKPGKIKLSELGTLLTAGTDLSSPARCYIIYYGELKNIKKSK